jgi:hypothetical protein
MHDSIPLRLKHLLPAVVALAASAVWLGCAGNAGAGIIAPQQIDFNADDLAQSATDGSGAGASTSYSSTNGGNPQRLPWQDNGEQLDPLSLLDSHLPAGSTSSSSSTSSVSGVVVSVVCSLNSTITLRDDSPLGRLAEERDFFLPDPPGTDLLRPPRG